MVRYKLSELMENKRFQEGKRVTIGLLAEETGVARSTLSNILNVHGYNTTVEVVEKLCRYFQVGAEKMIVFVDNPREKNAPSAKVRSRPKDRRAPKG